jgi:hypothetical protein
MSPPLVLVMWGHRRCPMVAPTYFGTGRSMPAANTEISAQIAACRKKQIGCLAAMAGIARKIELYNLVYRLAWEHISEHQRREQPDIARHLHESIRRQVNEGATEAVFIASEALRDIEKS